MPLDDRSRTPRWSFAALIVSILALVISGLMYHQTLKAADVAERSLQVSERAFNLAEAAERRAREVDGRAETDRALTDSVQKIRVEREFEESVEDTPNLIVRNDGDVPAAQVHIIVYNTLYDFGELRGCELYFVQYTPADILSEQPPSEDDGRLFFVMNGRYWQTDVGGLPEEIPRPSFFDETSESLLEGDRVQPQVNDAAACR